MKIEIYVELTSLNNFHLIHKGDFLVPKCLNYALKLLIRCKKIQRSKISIITINANYSTHKNRRPMKIEIQIVSTSLNNYHLIHKGDFLMIKVPNYALKLLNGKNNKFKVSVVIKIQII